jgi:hypothetical protein
MHEDTIESAKPGQNRRLFPRLNAGLPIRIQSTDANGATDYLAGKDPESTAWVTPDPYMNFSVEGLELNATQSFPKGQILLIELRIGTQDQSWRCTGHVVRNSPSDDPDFPCTTAVSFDRVPPQASEALAELTAKLQQVFLGKR